MDAAVRGLEQRAAHDVRHDDRSAAACVEFADVGRPAVVVV